MASINPDALEVSGRRNQPQSGCDDVSTGVSCGPCHSNKRSSNAEYYCVVCDEFMCIVCAETHRGLGASKNHLLLGRDKMPRKRLTEGNFCSLRDHKIFEFHCKTDDILGCTDCFISSHVGCHVENVKDIANQFDKSTEYLTLNKNINNLEKQLETINNGSQTNLANQERSYKKFLFDINDFRNDINEVLESLESSAKKAAETRKQNGDRFMRFISSNCDTMTSELQKISTSLREQEQYKLNHHLVLTSKKAQTQVSLFKKRTADLESNDKVGDYIFHRDRGIVHMLQSVTSLGTLSDKQDEQSPIQVYVPVTNRGQDAMNEYAYIRNPDFIRDQSTDRTERIVETTRNLQIRPHITSSTNEIHPKKNDVSMGILIKHVADTDDCWITGSVKRNHNKLVVVDHRNQSIKVVHLSTGIISGYKDVKQYGKPWDITCVNTHLLVATCGGSLIFLSPYATSFNIVKQITLGGECRGIDYHDNCLYVACISPQSAVKVVSIEGVELKCLTVRQTMGHHLCQYSPVSCHLRRKFDIS